MVAKGWGRWGPHASLVAPHRPTRIGSSDRQVLTDRCWAGVGGARGPVSVCVCGQQVHCMKREQQQANRSVRGWWAAVTARDNAGILWKFLGMAPHVRLPAPCSLGELQSWLQMHCKLWSLDRSSAWLPLCYASCGAIVFFFLCPNRVVWFRSLDGLLCMIEISGVNNG